MLKDVFYRNCSSASSGGGGGGVAARRLNRFHSSRQSFQFIAEPNAMNTHTRKAVSGLYTMHFQLLDHAFDKAEEVELNPPF